MTEPLNYFGQRGIRFIRKAGVTDEDAQKFVLLFDEAWERIPSGFRDLIFAYWRSRSVPMDCRDKPNTKGEYESCITLYQDRELPATLFEGHSLLFYSATLREMGDYIGVMVIAHELAHMTFYAESECNHWTDYRTPGTNAAAENLVHNRVLEWGWDHHALLAWRDKFESENS